MTASELRIGNWVDVLGISREVLGISNKLRPDCGYYEFSGLIPLKGIHINPIPITEEWLLKFGFKDVFNEGWFQINDFWIQSNSGDIWLGTKTNTWRSLKLNVSVKRVHQLQNLYFALTGEELKTKNYEH